MSFKNPWDHEKQAKAICQLLGITELTPYKFKSLVRMLQEIRREGVELAHARLGRGVLSALENIESILSQLQSKKQ